MAQRKIQINKGLFENVDAFEVGNEAFATSFKNGLINDAGSNVIRPGLASFGVTGNSYAIQGLHFFSGAVVAVDTNRQIWSFDSSGTATEITGTKLLGTSRPVFAEDGTYLAIAGGGAPRRWNGTGNTELMPGSPVDCTHMSYLDGYWINHLLSDQEFRIAGPTSATRETWNSSDFFQAEGLPDNVVAQAVLLREFWSLGAKSCEIFQNYGDTVTPFQRTFFVDTGCIAPYSLVKADNTLWWLNHDRRIVKAEGRTPVMISGPFDKTIKGLTTVTDCWGTVIDIDGFYLIAWTFPSEERTFVYDYKSQNWSEWEGYINQASDRFKMHSYAFADTWNRHFVGDPTTGSVLEMKFSTYQDSSETRRFARETAHITHGTDMRKRSNYYLLNIKTGLGTPGGTEPLLMLQVNDDDRGWTNEKLVELGFVGEDNTVVKVRMPGIYRRRRLRIVYSDNTDFKLNSIEENFDAMVS